MLFNDEAYNKVFPREEVEQVVENIADDKMVKTEPVEKNDDTTDAKDEAKNDIKDEEVEEV